MKRSDFDQQSSGLWQGSRYSHNMALREYIDLRREGAEAAGVVWDPEEEPLPESLIFYHEQIQPGKMGREAATLGTWAFPPDESRARVLREAVRRYNAWPELLRLLEDYNGGGWTSELFRRLEEILRGS